jgi:ribose transport system substrate-binding protein
MNNTAIPPATRRGLLGGAAGLAALGALAAPAAAAAAEQDEYVVAGALLSIPFWEDPIAGMQAAAAKLGVKVTFIGPDAWDAAQQVSQIEQVLIRRPKGLVVLPVDPKSVQPVIASALKQGVPVVTADTDAPETGRLSYLGTDRYQSGVQAADALIAASQGKGKVGIVTLGGSQALELSLNGFRDRIAAAAPGIAIGPVVDDQGDPQRSVDSFAGMIQGTEGLTALYGNGTQQSSSAAAAVRQAGKIGKLVVVGNGATLRTKDVMQAVADGVVTASITQRSFQAFYYAIQFLVDINSGASSEFGLPWAKSGVSPLPTRVDTGTIVVTKENVAALLDKLDHG